MYIHSMVRMVDRKQLLFISVVFCFYGEIKPRAILKSKKQKTVTFMTTSTMIYIATISYIYTKSNIDPTRCQIVGDGKLRIEYSTNPCIGGLIGYL